MVWQNGLHRALSAFGVASIWSASNSRLANAESVSQFVSVSNQLESGLKTSVRKRPSESNVAGKRLKNSEPKPVRLARGLSKAAKNVLSA